MLGLWKVMLTTELIPRSTLKWLVVPQGYSYGFDPEHHYTPRVECPGIELGLDIPDRAGHIEVLLQDLPEWKPTLKID